MLKLRRAVAASAAAGFALAAGTALAQSTYPAKPIRVIVPFPTGGSADVLARMVGQKFLENTKQPLIIENRPGADTIIGMEIAKGAPADGYTIIYAIGSALTMNASLYPKLPYDPVRDFAPVMIIANVPLALAAHPSLPARNVQELAALIKAKPGDIFYGQANIISKIAIEALSLAAGGKMTEVAYKGSAQSIQAIIAGEVKVTIVAGVLPYVQSGKLRLLAVTGNQRSDFYPGVPTIDESGIPGYAFNNWHAILAPANTPRPIVQRLHAELARAARDPDVVQKAAPLGVEVVAGTPEELQTQAANEREYWSRQIRTLGIKAE